ncbi:hypothetical protein WICPIJ_004319 [Wickerhamomyces pijperi]|uniref:Uncharacterized protein n=1 Tax=Wickerhamomyces pijperi TaxID=599730 RepID=A0A9P8Q5U7_WICPI|nr:hypothetical protein WICPIJ_004319 [Wickerhamomyces pijperi]
MTVCLVVLIFQLNYADSGSDPVLVQYNNKIGPSGLQDAGLNILRVKPEDQEKVAASVAQEEQAAAYAKSLQDAAGLAGTEEAGQYAENVVDDEEEEDSIDADTDAAGQTDEHHSHQKPEKVYHINDFSSTSDYHNLNSYQNLADVERALAVYDDYKKFFNDQLFPLIAQSKPTIGSINNGEHYNKKNSNPVGWLNKIPVNSGKLRESHISEPIRSKNYLSSFLQLSDSEKQSLKDSHANFVEKMPAGFPESIDVNIKGDGILYCGGGRYNWLVLLSLKRLRETGSKLPVEVFMPSDSDYSQDLCERVFPAFGAKCLLMSNYLDTAKFKLQGYQLKSMALMLTSFEKVLMLDSDNYPLKNPDYLFINEPFTSKHMVIWPDFWRRSTSPLLYDIAGIEVEEMNKVRDSYNGDERDYPEGLENFTREQYNANISFHDLKGAFPEASSETGQILVNRRVHSKSMLLSFYYNYYGPEYYYALFSQGQAGEGDKDTVLTAAHYFGLPYYQVQEFIREFGDFMSDPNDSENVRFEIAAMGQYDPIIDQIQSSSPETFKSDFKYDSRGNNYYFHKYKNSELMFLHTNMPKLYPWKINGKGFKNIFNQDGTRKRLYSKLLINELGFDFEYKIWEDMEWVLCRHSDFRIHGLQEPLKWCLEVGKHKAWLEADISGTVLDRAESKLQEGTGVGAGEAQIEGGAQEKVDGTANKAKLPRLKAAAAAAS